MASDDHRVTDHTNVAMPATVPAPATLAAARDLVARGLNVIPLDHPADTRETDPDRVGKSPVIKWKAFQQVRPTDADLVLWFGNGHKRNSAIVTGTISRVVVVDGDSVEGLAWMHAHLPVPGMRTKTAKGEHWIFQHPGVPVRNKVKIRTGDPAIKIDIRADGGYVVAPGSQHYTGIVYERLGDWPPVDELPVFDPGWLEPDAPDARPVPHACERADHERALRNAREYLDAVPPAIEGAGGDAHTFTVCASLVRGFDLTEGEAFDLLRPWNARCTPPWPDDDLQTKIRNARDYGTEPIGGRATRFPYTEAGDAECFGQMYGERVRYDHRQGRSLVADPASGIWVPDPIERLTQMAVAMMRQRQRDALTVPDDQKRKALAWAIGGEARKRITNTLALARSVPPIADAGDTWDLDPLLLGVPNGAIDLRDGTFRKAAPADRITLRVRVAFDPAATCPLWLNTLADIFAPPADPGLPDLNARQIESRRLIDFLQRAIGYSITGDCREECCFFLWGTGCNGKSTIVNTLGWLFADYCDDMPYSTLERSERGSGIPNDVAKLVGKRFITCAEVNEFNVNEARLKALTGRDPMTARFLNREFFTFTPVCKIWICTNNKPTILGQDDGIWRRLHLIPFVQTFEGRENKQLKDQLRLELPGILNWIVAGAARWLDEGLNPPDTVKAATNAYRQESNPITPFVETCCVLGTDRRMQAAGAWTAYEEFCRGANLEPWKRLSDKAFHAALRKLFAVEKKRQTFYLGVGLRTEPTVSAPNI